MESLVPEEEKLAGEVIHLFLNRNSGPSGMMLNHLWACQRLDTREESPEPSLWDMVVGLIQANFREGHLEEECACHTIALNSKGGGNFSGIRLVEVLWKNVMGILNC